MPSNLIEPQNCKAGSAWHEWQSAGRAWRCLHPDASNEKATRAASEFANVDGWPDAGKDARFRAFMEGAK